MSVAYLLSNGRYRVILTDRGTGYSACENIELTTWTADPLGPPSGLLCYLRDEEDGHAWLTGIGRPAIATDEHGIDSRLQVAVDSDSNTELRLLTLVNRTDRPRRLSVTTCLEVTLNDPAAHVAHPAFSKLFIETERHPSGALLARRRPRTADERTLLMGHQLTVEGQGRADTEFETSRARFIGRGASLAKPRALEQDVLSGSVGPVLDPVLALRRRLTLPAGASARLVAILAADDDRDALAARLTDSFAARAGRVLEESASREATRLRDLGVMLPPDQLASLTGTLLFGDRGRGVVSPGSLPEPSSLTPADLSKLGVSHRDLLVLARVSPATDKSPLHSLARVVSWWRSGGMPVTLLVLLDGTDAGSLQDSQGMVIRSAAAVTPELQGLAERCARLTLDRVSDPDRTAEAPQRQEVRVRHADPPQEGAAAPEPEPLRFFNGYGGFSPDGTEYVIRIERENGRLRLPPRPWINVVSNPAAGFITSETGAGYTWTLNSRENRLTPWSNDPVLDVPGEALYLRDEDRGVFWSPTPGPTPGPAAYEVRHGFGYSTWRHTSFDLEQETTAFVPTEDPVKLVLLRVTNRGGAPRRLSVWSYARWVLGKHPDEDGRFIDTAHEETGALLAVHPYRGHGAGRVAFAGLYGPERAERTQTADRTAFLGPSGDLSRPASLISGGPLDGRTGAGLDPCAATRITLELAPGATVQCVALLGEAADRAAASQLLRRYADVHIAEAALAQVREWWRETLDRVQVSTPSDAIDLMANGWLAYQNLSCRMWGRSAFDQSGGAYGFRDQLQDSCALMWLSPETTRAQTLLHAAHQFPEGDVLHWWHPPDDRGIRTRFADDPVWLPYVTAEYLRHTGDTGLLDEPVGYLEARALDPGEAEAFLLPRKGTRTESLYEHCCRALERSLTRGAHGLPLIGGGDWNDGMNRVGRLGRGESVWLGFFLFTVLERFLPWCEARGDADRAYRFKVYLRELRTALNQGGWDGDWYRRAYYDDGTPIGSAQSDECRIDAIAQAWAVLSGAAPADRAAQALNALERHLVDAEAGLIRLLDPPFDKTPHDPGYIKGYIPGVRENGGQYTHGALWAIRALAEAGRSERVAALLEMLSPVTRAGTPERVAVYQGEPYVVAADVYGRPPHVGRAGWTWYTGSAGWMYRVAIESLLGLTIEDGVRLLLRPCIPAGWPGFSIRYRHTLHGTRRAQHDARYTITVRQESPRATRTAAVMDGSPLTVRRGAVVIPLLADGAEHRVEVRLGDPRPATLDQTD